MIQSPTQAVTDAYQLISELDRALVAVYGNSDADFPMQDAAHDAHAIEAWNAAAPDDSRGGTSDPGMGLALGQLPGPRAPSGL